MSKLDDLLTKTKTFVPILDLSKNIIQSKEEFKRLMEKVPDYKMRPIKVRADEIKTKDKDFTFKPSQKELKKLLKNKGERDPLYPYTDPVPCEMRDVILMDLCAVPIDWKMLTTLRPKSKQEEEYFSRMVEMGKLQLKTYARDLRELTLNSNVRKVKNKSGILEIRLLTCSECGEEMCCGRPCTECNYDLFVRTDAKLPKPKPSYHASTNKEKNFAIKDRKKSNISAGKLTTGKFGSSKRPAKK